MQYYDRTKISEEPITATPTNSPDYDIRVITSVKKAIRIWESDEE